MMKMKTNQKDINVLFISPSSMPLYQQEIMLAKQSSTLIPKFETPTGLIELASFIRNKLDYVNFQLLDCAKDLFMHHVDIENKDTTSVYEFYKQELDKVEFEPQIVGLSVLFSSSYLAVLKICEYIKERWPNAIVVLGGGHVTFYHNRTLKDSEHVDYVFIGEAELGLLKFIEHLHDTGKPSANITGVYDRAKVQDAISKGIRNADFGDLLVELDEIGLPAYDLLDIETYKLHSNAYKAGAIGVMMDRGCPFKCTYCASMIIHGSSIRTKSNERIKQDLLYLRDECGFKNIVFWDDLLAAKKSKFMDLSDSLVEENVTDGLLFSMPSGLSVRIMNNNLIDSITALGFDYVRIMIESGSEHSQEHLIKKKVDLNKARDLISYTRTKGVKVETNILFGFPGETKEYMQQTIDYIKTIDVDWIQVFAALPLPGTEMFHQFASEGIIDPNDIDWDRCGYSSREFDTDDIKSQELTDLVYDVNIYTNFFGNRNMKQGRYERAASYFTNMVLNNYPFHVVGLYMRSMAYKEMGKKDEYLSDLKSASEYIKQSNDARRLFTRYGSELPELHEYVDEEILSSILPNAPSVDAGFRL